MLVVNWDLKTRLEPQQVSKLQNEPSALLTFCPSAITFFFNVRRKSSNKRKAKFFRSPAEVLAETSTETKGKHRLDARFST